MSYKLALPKNYSRRIWRAIMEFEMLQPGDKVLVGLSGGKDSALLLFALKVLQQQTGYPFELGAVTVDAGFSSESYQDILTELCTALSVPLYYERHPELQEIVFDPQHRQNPCARCAFFRRGIINRIAVKEGYNKVALGHHLDDAVETFLMSILLAGKIETFTPVTSQDRSQVTVIRPLVLLREKEITGAKRFFPWEPLPSCCPQEGNGGRALVKQLIRELSLRDPQLFWRVVSAMRRTTEEIVLWPAEADALTMRSHYLEMLKHIGK